VAGFCEHGNELSVFHKRQVISSLSDYQLLEEDSTPWSEL